MRKTFSLNPDKPHQLTAEQLDRLDRMTDADIDYSDIPELDDEFFATAQRVPSPEVKQQLTIRLDGDVLAWLKSNGRGYQTRINHILRAAMQSESRARAKKARVK